MTRQKNRVHFDPDTKTQSFPTATQIPSQSPLLHWRQVNFDQVDFDAPTRRPSLFRSRHENQVIFGPHVKIKSIPIFTLRSSQIRSPTLKWSQSRPPHKKEAKFDGNTKTKWFMTRLQKRSQFRPPTQKSSQSISTWKTSDFRPAQKHKSIAIPVLKQRKTWKPNDYRPAHKTKIHLDSPHKKVNLDAHIKMKSTWIAHTKAKFVLTPAMKSSQFRFPL